MAWESREESAGRYLYRSVREGRHVRKEYLGTGELAELLALADELERVVRRDWKRLAQAQIAAVLEGEDQVRTLDLAARAMVRSSLLEAGFRQHHRGAWRRRRPRRAPGPTSRRRRAGSR